MATIYPSRPRSRCLGRGVLLAAVAGMAGLLACQLGLQIVTCSRRAWAGEPASRTDGAKAHRCRVVVSTEWPGAGAQEIEEAVSYPLESRLMGVAGVKTVRSRSEPGRSTIAVTFNDDVTTPLARQRVAEALAQVAPVLPERVTPTLQPSAGQPVYWYRVEANPDRTVAASDLWLVHQHRIVPALQRVAGVAEIVTAGGAPPEYRIEVDPMKLRAYGLTLGDVSKAVADSNRDVGGGIIEGKGAEYLVRTIGRLGDVEDLENVVVRVREGAPVLIRDVAHVRLATKPHSREPDRNGAGLGGVVMMRHGEKRATVEQGVSKSLQEIRDALPEDVRIKPVTEGKQRREMLPPRYRAADVEVRVFGPGLETVDRVSHDVATILRGIAGAKEVTMSAGKQPRLDLSIDRRKAARYGVRIADIAETIEGALQGRIVAQAAVGPHRIPVRVVYAGDFSKDVDALRKLPVTVKDSAADPERQSPQSIPLDAVVQVQLTEGPSVTQSENGRRLAAVTLNVRGRSVQDFLDEARPKVAEKVQPPPGVLIQWSEDP